MSPVFTRSRVRRTVLRRSIGTSVRDPIRIDAEFAHQCLCLIASPPRRFGLIAPSSPLSPVRSPPRASQAGLVLSGMSGDKQVRASSCPGHRAEIARARPLGRGLRHRAESGGGADLGAGTAAMSRCPTVEYRSGMTGRARRRRLEQPHFGGVRTGAARPETALARPSHSAKTERHQEDEAIRLRHTVVTAAAGSALVLGGMAAPGSAAASKYPGRLRSDLGPGTTQGDCPTACWRQHRAMSADIRRSAMQTRTNWGAANHHRPFYDAEEACWV